MSKFKLVMLSLLAVFAASAAVSATASAGPLHWYHASGAILPLTGEAGALKITSTGGEQLLTATTSGLTIKIKCEHLDNTGELHNGTSSTIAGLGLVTLLYLECIVTPAGLNCVIPEKMITAPVLVSLIGTNALPEALFLPDNSSHFVEITFEKCTQAELNKKFPVDGSALGMINNTTSEVTVFEVKGSNSMLFFNGAEASLSGSDLVLMEGDKSKLEAKE